MILAPDRSVTLIVHLIIPISDLEYLWSALVFGRWLPGLSHGPYTRRSGAMFAKLYVVQSSPPDLADEGLDLIERHGNMSVYRVNVDVQIEDVQPKIAEFIWSENGRDLVRELPELMKDSEYARLRNEYQRLGHEVLGFAVETYNRLIDYARTEKRQFWLNKQRFDEVNPAQSAIGFRATVSAEGARLPGEIRFDHFPNVIKRTVILDVKQKLDGLDMRSTTKITTRSRII